MKVELKDKERIDDLQRNGYQIIQNPEKFCFGMDAVLLTGFAHAREKDILLDLGTGTGIIPLLMEAKYHCSHLTGLEIQEESADMARRSVALNDLQDRIDIVTGDIKEADRIFQAASFDCITCNPPYMIGQHGLTNPEEPKAIARHEVLCTLEDVVSRTAKLLKPGGHFLHGTSPLSAGGDHDHAGKIQAGAEADAAGVSLHRQGAQYGAHRGGARRQIPHDRGETVDRVPVTGSIYAGNI